MGMPALFRELDEAEPMSMAEAKTQGAKSGIYAFVEEGKVVHVGRTRNLKRRLHAHIAKRHNSASFAFKCARRELNRPATYTREGGRGALMTDPAFGKAFEKQIARLKGFQVKFVESKNPVEQYLLELYAHIEYGLLLDEFDTH